MLTALLSRTAACKPAVILKSHSGRRALERTIQIFSSCTKMQSRIWPSVEFWRFSITCQCKNLFERLPNEKVMQCDCVCLSDAPHGEQHVHRHPSGSGGLPAGCLQAGCLHCSRSVQVMHCSATCYCRSRNNEREKFGSMILLPLVRPVRRPLLALSKSLVRSHWCHRSCPRTHTPYSSSKGTRTAATPQLSTSPTKGSRQL